MYATVNKHLYYPMSHLRPQKRQTTIITIPPMPVVQIRRPQQICRLSRRSDHRKPTIGHRWNQTKSAGGKTAVRVRPGFLLYRQPKRNRDSYIVLKTMEKELYYTNNKLISKLNIYFDV